MEPMTDTLGIHDEDKGGVEGQKAATHEWRRPAMSGRNEMMSGCRIASDMP
jgi:hypothetical protein